MRFANTADFFHDRRLRSRAISKKSPVGTTAAINDVVNRRRTQDISWLNVPMFHKLLLFALTAAWEHATIYGSAGHPPYQLHRGSVPPFWGQDEKSISQFPVGFKRDFGKLKFYVQGRRG